MKLNAFTKAKPNAWLPKSSPMMMDPDFPRINGSLKRQIAMTIKLTTMLLIVALTQISAKGFSQKINLHATKMPLEKVLHNIESQTGYVFFFDAKLVKQSVTVQVSNASITEALNACLNGSNLTYQIADKTIFIRKKKEQLIAPNTAATPIKISGRVTDSLSKPMAGATVLNTNSHLAVLTNNNGEFSLTVNAGDQITISFIGYNVYTFIVTKSIPYQNIVLHEGLNKLKEVVVSTGYQDIAKERATGSFYKLDHELLDQRVGTDMIGRIEGLTSSLQIDRRNPIQQTIQIRGLSTLDVATASPLIVLDNFPYAGDINNINPNDVESVTVLKDAAASSIWGARAGNGVVVINTKKAKLNQPLQISLNSNVSLKPRPNLFSAQQIPVSSYIDLEKYLFTQGYYDNMFSDPTFPAVSQVVDLLNQARTGVITSAQADQQINQLRSQDVRNDMQKYLYRNEVDQQYYLNITGSGSNIRYLLSAGYDKDNTSLQGNGNDRISLRSNNQIDLSKKWQLNTDVIITNTHSTNNSPGGLGSYKYGLQSISPYAKLANSDGSPAAINLQYSRAFTDTAGNGRLLDWKYRPLQELANNHNTSKMTDILLNAGLTYKILPLLKADVKYQYQQSWSSTDNLQNLNTFSTRDYINIFTQLSGSSASYAVPKKPILSSYDQTNRQEAFRGQLSFEHLWGARHRLTAIAGTEIRETKSNSSSGITYGFDPNTLTTIPVDYATPHPTYDGINGDSYISDLTKYTAYLNRFVSFFANAAYTLDNKYTISASARRDESNLFGVSTNQKGVPLWSTGALWNISREKFYNISWLPELSLRVTYGVSGNLSPNESALTRIQYSTGNTNPIKLPFVSITAPPNPNLRWEQVKILNFGLDFGLFNNRLYGSIEYYTKRSEDLINGVLLDPTVGFGSSNQNSASIFAKGVDIVLNSINLNGSFKWKSTLLLSQVNYRVTKNLNPPTENGLVSDGTYIFPVLNQNPYVIVSYKWAGLDPKTGDPQGYVNGVVSKDYAAIEQNPLDQQVISGSALPTVFGTFRNTLEWHHISLAFNLSYRFNYYFRKPTTSYSSLLTGGSGYPDFDQRWQKAGDELHTNTPSFIYPGNDLRDNFFQRSSVNVEKADNIKLEEIYLSYDIQPSRPLFGIKSFQLYLFVNQLNLMLWKANKAGLDPDILYNFKPPISCSAGLKFNL